jgi:hypothetical protein
VRATLEHVVVGLAILHVIAASVVFVALLSCSPAQPAAGPGASSGPAPKQDPPPDGRGMVEPDPSDEASVAKAAEPQAGSGASPSQAAEPPSEGQVQGLKAVLDDGSYLLIPYGDAGLDYCAAVVVQVDGTRAPHRPPDARSKCSEEWARQDASKTD